MELLKVIDGVLVGIRYYDETQPFYATTSLPRSATDNLAIELRTISTAVSPVLRPREKALSSIEHVRTGVQCYWRHFVRVADSLGMPVITDLREMYRDAKGLLEAAIFAFRNASTDLTPNDLKKIFAFCSLSYVVSSMLHERGRFDKAKILAGISLWLNALKKQDEREAFKQLAERLWHEEYHHLHFIDQGRRDHLTEQAMGAPIYGSDPASSYVSESSFGLTPLTDFQGSGLQSRRFPMADSATQDSDLYPTDAEHWQQLASSLSPDLAFPFDPSLSPDPSFSPELSSITTPQSYYTPGFDMTPIVPPNVVEQPTTSCVPDTTLASTDGPEKLCDTSVFAAVLQYFQYNGEFWYELSGRGVISKDIRSLLSWNQECAREKERIHNQFLKHLVSEKKSKDITSRGIVSVVEALVEMGYLQSIDEAMNYMTMISKSLFSDTGAYNKFIAWITSK
ncbi:hypothetical protein BHE90_000562 [Fusarium euwallaceae]|uniref:Uncharacterized protein n=1 Tax=Fusarium euwallaceae TaxID=1147111 RepID=A0A430MA51_9HYPO|nr:hypothetical protein BHE90_000562 [Fusarium euwallaceae]